LHEFGFKNEYWNYLPIDYNWNYNLGGKSELAKYYGIKKGITIVIPFKNRYESN